MTTATDTTATTKRVRIIETREVYVDLPIEDADTLLASGTGMTEIAEELTRLRRVAHGNLNDHSEGSLSVEDATDVRLVDGWDPTPLDGAGRPSYLWTARSKVAAARYELSSGRYREGNCPELDEVNRDLGVLEERLRVMALAAQGLDGNFQPLTPSAA